MKREEYIALVEQVKEGKKDLENLLEEQKQAYIESNKPCDVGDEVSIKLSDGRKVTGKAKAFGILNDKNVYVTAYQDGSKTKYITVPYSEITKTN